VQIRACAEAGWQRKTIALEAGIKTEWRVRQVQAYMQPGIDKGMFRGRQAGKAVISVAGIDSVKVLPLLVWQYNISMIV
jgi:hypothetical protein